MPRKNNNPRAKDPATFRDLERQLSSQWAYTHGTYRPDPAPAPVARPARVNLDEARAALGLAPAPTAPAPTTPAPAGRRAEMAAFAADYGLPNVTDHQQRHVRRAFQLYKKYGTQPPAYVPPNS